MASDPPRRCCTARRAQEMRLAPESGGLAGLEPFVCGWKVVAVLFRVQTRRWACCEGLLLYEFRGLDLQQVHFANFLNGATFKNSSQLYLFSQILRQSGAFLAARGADR